MNNTQRLGRADVHMHTSASDGLPSVRELLDYVAQRGHLDVIAITDHDVLDASLEAYEQRQRYPFDIIPGVEVTSAEGHVLGLWVTCPIPMGMSLAETTAAIHEQGGNRDSSAPFSCTCRYSHSILLALLAQPTGVIISED
jgi:predicted metal-dependent phosphoesterase TrpH